MVDLKTALNHLDRYEGGYSNTSSDTGGETYRGISRRAHPDWVGWDIIDEVKAHIPPERIEIELERHPRLDGYVRDLYQKEYWEAIGADHMQDQQVANEAFEIAVHMGPRLAVEFLQQALNALNYGETWYTNLRVDGRYGPNTNAALETYLSHDKEGLLTKLLNIQQGYRYIQILQHDQEQEVHARGWFRRVELTKHRSLA